MRVQRSGRRSTVEWPPPIERMIGRGISPRRGLGYAAGSSGELWEQSPRRYRSCPVASPCLTPLGDVVRRARRNSRDLIGSTRGRCQGGVMVRLKVPCAPPYPSTTMKYVCPAVTVGVRREARNRPVELVHASSLHPASDPLAHAPLRR